MTPENKAGLRRLAIVVSLGASYGITYALHLFHGWTRGLLTGACGLLILCLMQLLRDEGRECERKGR
jgi:hypothetical protein